MELVSILFCCLPYCLLFILCESVINNVINVTPCEGIGPSKMEEFLMVSFGLSEKEPNHCSIWEISSIEKGTWTLIVPSIPATYCRGAGGGCVDVDSCRSVGVCIGIGCEEKTKEGKGQD
jgi:hypothetical protein